ncbi:F-box/LRR-repeat protein 5 [Frankliniella fusca]|uniref:F-box/LRR-repeat protein 5 n=1 Tax=Frankliniella fusca TaxID=407009 RepID=A0AAE1HS78_9NEOP|nr:F-box/LRR-repeat protein 5 [Frankliniella fusca]
MSGEGQGPTAPPGPSLWPLWPGKRRRMFEEEEEDEDEEEEVTVNSAAEGECDQKTENTESNQESLPTINDLPDEILLMIFQYLDPFTLANDASKVSKRWHTMAWDEAPWRSMHLQLDAPEAKEVLLKAPALRRLTVHSFGGYEPLLQCTTRIFELVITVRRLFEEPEPVPPLHENRFSFAEVLPRFSENLERLSVEVEITEEEFKVIDDHLDLKELRIVSNNLQKFPVCNRPRRRFLEYAHFEKECMLCHLPLSLLVTHGAHLRTLVGRVDEAAAQMLSRCVWLEAADLDLPSISSVRHMDSLQYLHTLRVSFRAEMEEEDRREWREEDRVDGIPPHFSQRLLRLSIYQLPTAYVIPESFVDVLSRYKDHLESLVIGKVTFRSNFHGVQVMQVIDQMPCLRNLEMGSLGWPAYPLGLKCLEVLKADIFSDWVSSAIESSKISLKKIMVDDIPEIVVEHYLSDCVNLDECIISISALKYLNSMERLHNLTLQIPYAVSEEMLDACSPVLSRITHLQAEGKESYKDDEVLRLLGASCSKLKKLTLRGWGREAGRGSWMQSFENVEFLTLDLSYQFRRSLVLRLIMGAMPKLRVLYFENQEGEYGTISDLDKLQIFRPSIRIEGNWKETMPQVYNHIQIYHHPFPF